MPIAIIGLAAYPKGRVWPEVEMLVRSARRNSPRSPIILLTTALNDSDRKQLTRFGVQAIEKVPEPPAMADDEHARLLHRQWVLELFGKRHALYREAAQAHSTSHCLITDTRDVVVTGDLTQRTSDETLVLAQEDASVCILAEPWTRQWITIGYGEKRLQELGERRVLCAGTVFGPRQLVCSYLEAMEEEVCRLGVEQTRQIGDQALHNHLAYSGRVPTYVVSRAEDGWIRTIGLQPFCMIRGDWFASRPSGSQPSRCLVVHQYDRHLANATIRRAVARAAGLSWIDPWRIKTYRYYGKDLGAVALRAISGYVVALKRIIRGLDGPSVKYTRGSQN